MESKLEGLARSSPQLDSQDMTILKMYLFFASWLAVMMPPLEKTGSKKATASDMFLSAWNGLILAASHAASFHMASWTRSDTDIRATGMAILGMVRSPLC